MADEALPLFTVTADVYNGAEVGVFTDREEHARWVEGRGLDASATRSASTNACARWDTDPDGLAWFTVFVGEDCAPERLAHECLHLAWYILAEHGVTVDADNHEALAYLMQHLHRQIAAELTPAE